MSNIVDLEKLFHRSKDRIRDLGEVFTPDSYVEEMLDLLAKDKRGLWSDEEISFFEPCSGHGNIVLPIYKRRLDGIYKKVVSQGGGAGFERGQFHRFTGPMGTIVTALKWDQRLKCQARSSALMVNQTDAIHG